MSQSRYAAKVTVVTPVYNAMNTLAETVASIRSQDMDDWELWLVDDGSDDGSAELAESLAASDPRINMRRLGQRSGAAAARNAGIKAARGRYLAFVDSDDLWDRVKLSRQVEALEQGAGFVFSAYRRIDETGRVLGTVDVPERVGYSAALQGNPIGCLTAIYDTEIYGKVPMPNIRRRQDYALWLELLRRQGPAVGIADCLASYRVRRGSLSANKIRAAQATWEVFRGCEKLGLARASWCFAHYAARAVRQRQPFGGRIQT